MSIRSYACQWSKRDRGRSTDSAHSKSIICFIPDLWSCMLLRCNKYTIAPVVALDRYLSRTSAYTPIMNPGNVSRSRDIRPDHAHVGGRWRQRVRLTQWPRDRRARTPCMNQSMHAFPQLPLPFNAHVAVSILTTRHDFKLDRCR